MLSYFLLLLVVSQDELDIFGLDLEDLLKVKVVTASRSEESPWEASSVVTILNRSEIALFGGDHVYDLLVRIPGLTPYVSAGVDRMTIRGSDPNLSAFHTLILIDGRPLRTKGGNNSLYYVFYGMPLSIIERIEVIRGPGAVLYGTNAMEGVINIITHSSEENLAEVVMGLGSFDQKHAEALVRQRLGSWRLHLAALYFDTKGWDYRTPDPATMGQTEEVKPVFQDTRSLRLMLENDYWNLAIFGGKTKQFGFTQFLPDLSYHSNVWQGNLSYHRQLNASWRMEHHLTFNEEQFDWIDNQVAVIPIKTVDSQLESTFMGDLSPRLSVIFGVSGHHSHTRNEEAPLSRYFDYRSDSYSGYGQLAYRGTYNTIQVGAQFNKVNGYATDLVPRLTLTRRLSDNLGLSLFYGNAYRSPQGLELNIDTPGVQKGNPNLDSETLTNLEARLFYHTQSSHLSLSLFRSKQENLIQFVPTQEYFIGEAQNEGELTVRGFEFESRVIIDSRLYTSASFHYQTNEDHMGEEDVTGMPNWSGKIGLGFQGSKLSTGLFATITGPYHQTERDGELPWSWAPESTTHYNISYNLTAEVFKRGSSSARLELFGNNLLDDQTTVKDLFFQSYNGLPGMPERTLSGRLRIRF